MSKIFISHSSHNNDLAIHVRDWLAENGWVDIFLDLDPRRGIVAGERWKQALQKAAHRCEVVLALVSTEWLASQWCKSEIDAARMMGKKVIVALSGLTKDQVPSDFSDEQWVDIASDPNGYVRLKEALRRAGLDPSTFPFDGNRRPYPGLSPLEEQDAAIFFGREAQTIRLLDRMRTLARTDVERLLLILGASGSGKSSFLRAGIWPRLKRDDKTWLPLKVVRPERAVISGKHGLVQSLRQILCEPQFSEAAATRDLPKTSAAIQSFIENSEAGLGTIVLALREAQKETQGAYPVVVIPIDQGEELFNEDGSEEAARFISLLTRTLSLGSGAVALVAMRSDAFPQLQQDPSLAACPKDLFTLDVMLEGAYRSIIEGPAQLIQPRPLEIDPELTHALLQDIRHQDALPLLALTLAHLYEGYSVNGRLEFSHYEEVGRLSGMIKKSVSLAIEEGVAGKEIPKDRDAQVALIRMAFVPHLARLNAAGQFVRRIAYSTEIPAEARALINRLIDHRLLTRDLRSSGEKQYEVIEVVHEAILREWPDLVQILNSERAFLADKFHLEQAVKYWEEAAPDDKPNALLTGILLDRVGRWVNDRPKDLTPVEAQFLQWSLEARVKESDDRKRRVLFGRLSAGGAVVLLGVAVAVGLVAFTLYGQVTGKCSVASAYVAPNGKFAQNESGWVEYQNGKLYANYQEQQRDATYVYITDSGRDPDTGRDFIVRIPKCGGMVEWTWSNPILWDKFQIVTPE
jgi:hypothetical protein